jgi:hypothetical protein
MDELTTKACAFFDAAVLRLERDRALPSRYHPWVTVGRDFFGPHLEIAERTDLER